MRMRFPAASRAITTRSPQKIGKPLEILDPGLAFKIFPSNFHTQAGVVAVLQMMREDGVKADDVERCAA